MLILIFNYLVVNNMAKGNWRNWDGITCTKCDSRWYAKYYKGDSKKKHEEKCGKNTIINEK